MTELNTADSSDTLVRWLIACPLSATPSGRRRPIDGEALAELLAEVGSSVTRDLGPALGAAAALATTHTFARLSDFTLKRVIADAPALARLRALAERLGASRSRRPEPTAALAELAAIVGVGPLHADVARCLDATPPADAAQVEGSLVDELLARGTAEGRAIDAFVTATRDGAKPGKGEAGAARAARDRIEAAVVSAARQLLDDASVVRHEALWRGLKLLLARARAAEIRVELIDVDAAGLLDAIERELERDDVDRPDAIFVVDPPEELATIAALAAAAERLLVPVVTALDPALLGASEPRALAEALTGGVPSAWASLRGDVSSRWLTACINPVVLAVDGRADAGRVVYGSPALAVATMLSDGYARSRGFAEALRADRGLQLPATRLLARDDDAAISVPTEHFVPRALAERLAEHGLLALHSRRNSDTALATGAPTVSAASDRVPLPAQLVTGRVVRFSLWASAQVPPGASPREVTELFVGAASVFLFPGVGEDAYRYNAALIEADGGSAVRVKVAVHPRLSGVLLELEFDLPLPTEGAI
ncbi:MAG: hypothetical protein KC636_09395 [Myxococcales bacterium]|nr:hypothetical protein [Myxococcales bacterium]